MYSIKQYSVMLCFAKNCCKAKVRSDQTDAHLKFLGALLISESLNSITTEGTKYFKLSIYCCLLKIYHLNL